MRQHTSERGFSAVEQTLAMLGIGAALAAATPHLSKAVEFARVTEAYQILGAIRTAEVAHHYEYGAYTTNADVLLTEVPRDNSRDHFFRYEIRSAGSDDFLAVAIRKTGMDVGKEPNHREVYTIALNSRGELAGNP